MKAIAILGVCFLSGCVSVELPGIVSDTVKVTKDVYKSATGDKTEAKNAQPGAATPRRMIAHSYIGKDSQTVAEIKETCVTEAVQKLSQMAGKELPYTVIENDIVTLNNNVAANCKVAVEN
jgi:hypothetical protein